MWHFLSEYVSYPSVCNRVFWLSQFWDSSRLFVCDLTNSITHPRGNFCFFCLDTLCKKSLFSCHRILRDAISLLRETICQGRLDFAAGPGSVWPITSRMLAALLWIGKEREGDTCGRTRWIGSPAPMLLCYKETRWGGLGVRNSEKRLLKLCSSHFS